MGEWEVGSCGHWRGPSPQARAQSLGLPSTPAPQGSLHSRTNPPPPLLPAFPHFPLLCSTPAAPRGFPRLSCLSCVGQNQHASSDFPPLRLAGQLALPPGLLRGYIQALLASTVAPAHMAAPRGLENPRGRPPGQHPGALWRSNAPCLTTQQAMQAGSQGHA